MPEYRLPFPPAGTNTGKKGRQRRYAEVVGELLPGPHRPLEGSVMLLATFFPPCRREFVRYDLDNLLKPTLDALKGIAYVDDNQVRSLRAKFGRRGGDGAVLIYVQPMHSHFTQPEEKIR